MSDRDESDLTNLHLSRLLPIGMARHRRPLDELIEHLEEFENDGPATLPWDGAAGIASLEAALARGEASLEELEQIKARGNTILKDPGDRPTLLGAMLVYFLVIAAGLVHRGTLLTSQNEQKIVETMRELSLVLPAPWRDLLDRAVNELKT